MVHGPARRGALLLIIVLLIMASITIIRWDRAPVHANPAFNHGENAAWLPVEWVMQQWEMNPSRWQTYSAL